MRHGRSSRGKIRWAVISKITRLLLWLLSPGR
jgi:hypothetical protein